MLNEYQEIVKSRVARETTLTIKDVKSIWKAHSFNDVINIIDPEAVIVSDSKMSNLIYGGNVSKEMVNMILDSIILKDGEVVYFPSMDRIALGSFPIWDPAIDSYKIHYGDYKLWTPSFGAFENFDMTYFINDLTEAGLRVLYNRRPERLWILLEDDSELLKKLIKANILPAKDQIKYLRRVVFNDEVKGHM